MVLPVFFILNAGRIISIGVGIGTALARFVAKNPKIIGSTISIEAISSAIQSYVATEKEKIDLVNEIGKGNPQLREDLLKNIFHPDVNILLNIVPYLVALLIIYFINMIQRTESKNNIHANKSWAKQSPAMKYATLNTTISKSETFVLGE